MRVCKRNIKCKKGWSINNFGNKFFRFILKFILCHTISILVLNNCCEVIYGRLLRKAYTIGGLIISGYYQYLWWINGTAPAWWVPWLLCRLMQGFFFYWYHPWSILSWWKWENIYMKQPFQLLLMLRVSRHSSSHFVETAIRVHFLMNIIHHNI